MNIKDKLRQIESIHLKKEISAKPNTTSISDHQIEVVINGKTKETPFGSYFYYEKDFPFEYSQGIIQISSFLKRSSATLSFVGKNSGFDDVDLRKVLFIDTETTGLSGGLGTCAFLIGVGYFVEDSFRLAQYFFNDLNEEYALLHDFNQLIEQHQLIVSYNGKCFDIPLLITRNVYHRLDTPLTRILHLDLLHTVRRMYKHRLSDCSLGTAEEIILKVSRNGDIPGYMIPQIYFHYLKDRDARPLRPVFYHNQQDILSLAALLTKIMLVFENPLVESESSYDLLSVGKTYEGMVQLERSIELYNKVLANKSIQNNRLELLFRTAFNYKKLKKWSQAVKIWNECLSTEAYHPIPYIELAKHYEHREKNFPKAKDIVEKALQEINILLSLNNSSTEWSNYKQDLDYRCRRLIQKMNNQMLLKE